MQVIETVVYDFDELNDTAKERARDWWRTVGEFPWFDEYQASLIAFCDKFRVRINESYLSDDYRATVVTDAQPHHFRGLKLKEIRRDEMLTGFTADCSLMFEFYDQFKKTGDAKYAFEQAIQQFLIDLRRDIESTYEDEYIDEMLTANQYTFTEDGKRF
jgi:hypothetical protein